MQRYLKLSSALLLSTLVVAQAYGAKGSSASTTPTLPDGWGDTHRALVKEAEDNADDIQIVLLGDSITYRWKAGAGKDVCAERYAPHGVINLGISADGIQHVIWRLENGEMAPLDPKMVLLLIGTNNLHAYTAEEIAYGVWKIVDMIRSEHSDTRVLVEAIFPRSRPAGRMDEIRQINKYLAKLDDGKMVKFIDFGEVFLNPDGSLNETWFTDGLHPEKEPAFVAWADSIQPIVDEWLVTPPVANVPPPPAPVPTPKSLKIIEPASRNDYLYKFNRFCEGTKRTDGHLLFLGDATMSRWTHFYKEVYGPEYTQYNPSFGAMWGNRTENILWQLENMPAGNIDPKLVLLQLQENLTEGSTAPEDVAAGVEAIIAKIHNLYPKANILIESALPEVRGKRVFVPESVTTYNAMLESIAQQDPQVYYLDLVAHFKDMDAIHVPNRFKSTEEAYREWAEYQRDIVAQLMMSKD